MSKLIKPKLKKIVPVNAGSTNIHRVQKTPKALTHGVISNEKIHGK